MWTRHSHKGSIDKAQVIRDGWAGSRSGFPMAAVGHMAFLVGLRNVVRVKARIERRGKSICKNKLFLNLFQSVQTRFSVLRHRLVKIRAEWILGKTRPRHWNGLMKLQDLKFPMIIHYTYYILDIPSYSCIYVEVKCQRYILGLLRLFHYFRVNVIFYENGPSLDWFKFFFGGNLLREERKKRKLAKRLDYIVSSYFSPIITRTSFLFLFFFVSWCIVSICVLSWICRLRILHSFYWITQKGIDLSSSS